MKILGLIPARGGSKGVPGKNIKLLGNKPLLEYTFNSAKESTKLNKVILSSDDDLIIACAKSLGLEAPFKRPSELGLDSTPTLPVIKHALSYYESLGEVFDAVCLLQVTYPFRKKGFIDHAIEKFISTGSDSLISVIPVPHEYNPHWVFEVSDSGFLKISTGESKLISRRQDLPKAYHRDGAIYVVKTEIIKNENSLYGQHISFLENDTRFYVNIDTERDWENAVQKLAEIKNEI